MGPSIGNPQSCLAPQPALTPLLPGQGCCPSPLSCGCQALRHWSVTTWRIGRNRCPGKGDEEGKRPECSRHPAPPKGGFPGPRLDAGTRRPASRPPGLRGTGALGLLPRRNRTRRELRMTGSQANSRVPETLWTDCPSAPSQVPQAMARGRAERGVGCRAPGQGTCWWGQCWVLGPLPSQAAGPSSGAETSPSAVLSERGRSSPVPPAGSPRWSWEVVAAPAPLLCPHRLAHLFQRRASQEVAESGAQARAGLWLAQRGSWCRPDAMRL